MVRHALGACLNSSEQVADETLPTGPHLCEEEPKATYPEAAASAAVEIAKQAHEVGLMWLALTPEKKREIKALIRSLVHGESEHADAQFLNTHRRHGAKQIRSDG